MSIQYCHECDKLIDTDTETDHFSPSVKSQIEIGEACGLTFQKMEDNAPQFLGTDKQFEAYEEELEIAEQEAIAGEEAKEEGLRDAIEFK